MNKISKIIKARWPEDEMMPASRPLDEFSSNLEVLIDGIRKYKIASWAFALILGIIYRYGYGVAKDLIWANRKLNFITEIVDPNSNTQQFFLIVGLNFTVDLSSVILPALICASVLIYIFHTRARLLSLPAVFPFLVFSRRACHFWEAPDLGLQISVLFGPILGVVVLLAVVFMRTRINKIAEQNAQPDSR
jgi:hypothetical protein